MEKSEVYHDLTPLFGLDKILGVKTLQRTCLNVPLVPYQGGPLGDCFKLVARVDSSSLEEIFRLTNHVDGNWTENEGVEPINGTQHRSTSVGDLVHLRTGKWYKCAIMGWEEIDVGKGVENAT